MRNTLKHLVAALVLLSASAAHAQLPWSEQTHQIAFGDFNGDGKTDLLYVAKSSSASSGIALSNNAGPYNLSQTWSSSYLGIAWHSSTYAPIVGDFNGDGLADVLLQRQAQGDHYLLLANAQGQLTAINQTLPFNQGGLIWSGDAHRIIAGDFDGDGRTDVFLQANDASGLNAVFLASSAGTFGSAQQTWGDVHIGFRWSLQHAAVAAGDFNGDGKTDLFVQSKPDFVLIDYDVPFPVPAYRAGSFGIANAKSANTNGEIFFTPALQIWDRNYQGVDWSAANFNAIVGDFTGDGRADVILQGRATGTTNSQFNSSFSGQLTTGNVLSDPTLMNATGDQYKLYAADFDGIPGAGVYLQTVSAGGSSSIAWNSTNTTSYTESYAYDALGRLRTYTAASGTQKVYNFDPAGNRSTILAAGTTPLTGPGGISGYSPVRGVVYLTWSPATGGTPAYTYYLEYCSGASCTNFVYLKGSTSAGTTVTGLLYPATYRFRVRARDLGGTGNYSTYSNVFNVTTQ